MENLSVDPVFWRGRRVFLTGHTGFKGSWLSLWLQQLGAELTGYALEPPTAPSLFEIAGVAAGMRSVIGDVRDPARLRDALAAGAHPPHLNSGRLSDCFDEDDAWVDPVE